MPALTLTPTDNISRLRSKFHSYKLLYGRLWSVWAPQFHYSATGSHTTILELGKRVEKRFEEIA